MRKAEIIKRVLEASEVETIAFSDFLDRMIIGGSTSWEKQASTFAAGAEPPEESEEFERILARISSVLDEINTKIEAVL